MRRTPWRISRRCSLAPSDPQGARRRRLGTRGRAGSLNRVDGSAILRRRRETFVGAKGPYTETWGPDRFGDPCRDCAFEWSLTSEQAIASVMGIPDSYEGVIGSADGSLCHPDLDWTVGAYVCHVADNLHI